MMKSRSTWLAAIATLLFLSSGMARAQQAPFEKDRVARVDLMAIPAVTVTGGVLFPVRVELRRPTRLNELFAFAGGATERTGKIVRVYRSVPAADLDRLLNYEEVRKTASFEAYKIAELPSRDEKANPFVRNGDVVYVEEVGMVYIAGDVQFPQRMKLTEGLTLRQAIGQAGGLRPGSEKDRIVLRRQGVKLKDETIFLSHNDVLVRGKDITLRPNDVVCVLGKMTIGRSCPSASLSTKRVIIAEGLPLRTLY